MRYGILVFLIACLLAMMLAVKDNSDVRLVRVLPFIGGRPPGIYDVAGLALIAFTLVRFSAMFRSDDQEDEEPEYEEVDSGDDEGDEE